MNEPRRLYGWSGLRIICAAAVFLLLTAFASPKNEICCMFSSCRHYGFPGYLVSLCKTTESLTEAQRVKTESLFSLISSGWKPSLSDDSSMGRLPAPEISLVADSALALIFGLAVDSLYLKSKKRKNDYAQKIS